MQRLQNLPMPTDESPRRLLGKSKSKQNIVHVARLSTEKSGPNSNAKTYKSPGKGQRQNLVVALPKIDSKTIPKPAKSVLSNLKVFTDSELIQRIVDIETIQGSFSTNNNKTE